MLVTGAGAPVTVVAHGFGASLAETRPLASGVPGTRVFLQARGHGAAPAPERPGYAELAADLAAVADAHGATQALGVSLGAATLLHQLAATPESYRRVVLFLPAALDRPRADPAVRRVAGLADALAASDTAAVEAAVRADLPEDLDGPAVTSYARSRAQFLLASPGLPALLEALAADVPVRDRSLLAAVTADVLVLAQEDDPLHPVQVARELVAVLPRARLVVFDRPGAVFRERARLRSLIAGHLTP